MNTFKIFLPVLILFISSCCSDVTKNKTDDKQIVINKTQPKTPTTIKQNQSIVTARVEEINFTEDDSYSIHAKIIEIKVNNAYESIAVKGSSYKLIPNFSLNENKKIDFDNYEEKNSNLLKLKKLKPGDEFNAIIFMGSDNNWYIQKVIN